MKINIILPFKRMTGGIRVIYIYANYLVEQGHDVVCYVPMLSYKGKGQSFLYRMKASLGNSIKKETWFDATFQQKIVPIISERFIRDADVVIATAWQTAYDVNKFPFSKGRKFYFIQGFETFNGEENQVLGSYQLPLKLITVSNGLKQQLSKVTSAPIEVVYNGLDDTEYWYGEKQKTELPSLLLMYHEDTHKRTQDGLAIIKRLKEKYPHLEVNIFGRRIPEKLPESYRVAVNPERNTILEMYRRSDIYLFTSDIESWGLPVVEAMANQCAVVGRPIGALSELYDGKNGVLVKELSEIEAEIEALIMDRELLLTLQKNGLKSVENLNWKVSAQRFISLITDWGKDDDKN